MPLPGGDADKVGNRYEVRWTVLRIIDVLEGRARSIYIEPLGDDGQGVEFVLRAEKGDTCYQIKRQHSRGSWSLAALKKEGVLEAFLQHLQRGLWCVFASMAHADELHELSERARESLSWDEFQQHYLKASTWQNNFESLRKAWGSLAATSVYEMLRRVEVRTQDEKTLEEHVLARITSLVAEPPGNVYDFLVGYALSSIHRELRADTLWEYLKQKGVTPRDLHRDAKLQRQLSERAELFTSTLEGLSVGGQMIAREEADRIEGYLRSGRRVLLTGMAGSGKSCLLAQVVRKVREQGWPVLILRADDEVQALTPEKYGDAIGLPAAPAIALSGVSLGSDALLVIDQLDAVSLASGRNPQRFETLLAIFCQAEAFPREVQERAVQEFDRPIPSRVPAHRAFRARACQKPPPYPHTGISA